MTPSNAAAPHARTRTRGFARLGLALGCLLAALPAAAAGYAADPAFDAGRYYEDAFASDSSLPYHDYSGRKLARAANGDLIVAALVDEQPLPPDEHQAVGLIRYDRHGTRVPWADPDPATTRYFDEYVFVPNTRYVNSIDALEVVDDEIVLLYTEQIVYGLPQAAIGRIAVLSDSGRLLSSDAIYFDRSSLGARGAGVALYHEDGATYAAVIATHIAAKRPVYHRWRIEADGALTSLDEAWPATSACWNAAWQCEAHGIALAQDAADAPPRLYVAYAFRANDDDDADVVVSRMDEHGAGDPQWDPNNVHWNLSDGGDRDDVPVGIAVRTSGDGTPSSPYRDDVYVATRSARSCRDGIGLIRFDHDGGVVGAALAGGSTSRFCNLGLPTSADIPNGLVLDGDRLVVPGRRTTEQRFADTTSDAELSSFSLAPASIGQNVFAYPIGQPRARDSEFLAATRYLDGRIALTGDLAFPAGAGGGLDGKQQVGTLRVERAR